LELSTVTKTLPGYCKQKVFANTVFVDQIKTKLREDCEKIILAENPYSCFTLSKYPPEKANKLFAKNVCQSSDNQTRQSIVDLKFERW